MKKINWEIFFGDSSSEEALRLFGQRKLTFGAFADCCSYSPNRVAAIKILKYRGYDKAIRAARHALKNRGYNDYNIKKL